MTCHKCGFKLDHSGKHVIGSPYGDLISERCPLEPRIESWRERSIRAQAAQNEIVSRMLDMASQRGIKAVENAIHSHTLDQISRMGIGNEDTLTFDELADKGDFIEDPWVLKILEGLS